MYLFSFFIVLHKVIFYSYMANVMKTMSHFSLLILIIPKENVSEACLTLHNYSNTSHFLQK